MRFIRSITTCCYKFFFISLLVVLLPVTVKSGFAASDTLNDVRREAARNFDRYDFEQYSEPIINRDLDGNGWPDFWEKIVDDKNKDYLARNIRIIPDPSRPSRIPGVQGSVLRIPFDGTGVAIRTKVPKAISPDMAYEIAVFARTLRLEKSLASLSAIWLNIDDKGERTEVGRNVLVVPPGQYDWTESPLRMKINTVPANANYMILQLDIYDNPEFVGADRDGFAWFDDIVIFSRPKIYMQPTFVDYELQSVGSGTPKPIQFNIEFRGLVDNVPMSDKTFKGNNRKSYYRVINIYDINGRPPLTKTGKVLNLGFEKRKQTVSGALTTYPETININLQRLGVYYVHVVLYGYKGKLLTERTQVVGLWMPKETRNVGADEEAQAGGFGVVINSVPNSILAQEGVLADIVERTGAMYVKSLIWPDNSDGSDVTPYLNALSREFTLMRRSGIRVTAQLKPAKHILAGATLLDIMKGRPQVLEDYINIVTRKFDMHIEYWQWGKDGETDFSYGLSRNDVADATGLLTGRTSSPSQSYPISLAVDDVKLPDPDVAYSTSIFVPYTMPIMDICKKLVALAPRYFTIFKQENNLLYPPAWLYNMSPVPEPVDETQTPQRKLEEWLSLELDPCPRDVHDATKEREMLDNMAKKAVIARVLNIPRTYIDSLIDPEQGLCRVDEEGHPVPMPALLGLRVLEQYLAGTKYLGSFYLRNQHGYFPNYVFARPNGEDAVAVVWYDGTDGDEAPLDFGGGYQLQMVDMQGNTTPVPASTTFIATKTPVLITGMSTAFARTRMSVDILRSPELLMQTVVQRQYLTMTNFFDQSISGIVELNYAARNDFEYEQNWTVQPERIRFNIARPQNRQPRNVVLPFRVRPPEATPVDYGKDIGEKLVSLNISLMGDRPENLRLIRQTNLTGDIYGTMRRLTSVEDPNVDIIQLKLKWIPVKGTNRKTQILLRPYYRKGNNLETLMPTVSVPAYNSDDDATPAISIEYSIPKLGGIDETWIGYRQEDGPRFFNYNISKLIGQETE